MNKKTSSVSNGAGKENPIIIIAFAAMVSVLIFLSGCSLRPKDQKIPVRVLILPKFEQGEMAGDFPGEAQYFYEEYLAGGDVYEIKESSDIHKLYYKTALQCSFSDRGKSMRH